MENKIEEAVNNKNSSQERQKKHKVISIATGSVSLAALIGGIVTFFLQLLSVAVILGCVFLGLLITAIVNFVKKNKAKKDFDNFEQNVQSFEEAKRNIRRDYKVSKLGVAYIPVATRVPF